MAKATKLCHFINGYICDDFQDCVGCGRCGSPLVAPAPPVPETKK